MWTNGLGLIVNKILTYFIIIFFALPVFSFGSNANTGDVIFVSDADQDTTAVTAKKSTNKHARKTQNTAQQDTSRNSQTFKEWWNKFLSTDYSKVKYKPLPEEFPDNYIEELQAYYERQSTFKKIVRKIEHAGSNLSFSTNVAFDAILIPNLAVEFMASENWGLSASWMHSWWSKKDKDIFWRVYGGDITARRWFGKKYVNRRLSGYHVGVYAQALTYDLDLGGEAQMSDGWNYAVGLELGHSFPISKSFNIDLYAGVGFLMGNYKEYINVDDHYKWMTTVNRKSVFPTKAGASLVWILPLKKKSILYEN